ncbi:LamG-like jellyroll fold domain-containing protein, partial [Nanoarchaeota archaeon]
MIFNRSLTAAQIKAIYENRTDLIVSDETNKGEMWSATVTPNDGYDDGATYLSNNVTIPANRVPTINTPVLNSTSGGNYTYDNLTLHITNTTDVDNDPVKNIINWYEANTSITVLNMPFEGGSNSTYTNDYSSHNNYGNVSGATWNSTAGYEGKGAYEFDGTNDFINISNATNLQLKGTLSVSAWVKTTDVNNTEIISKGGSSGNWEWILLKYNTDELLFATSQCSGTDYLSYTTDGLSINDGNWHHIVGTASSSAVKIYVDGAYVGQNTSTAGTVCAGGAEEVKIGYPTLANRDHFNGTIDEVMIFNKTLSAEQVKALYANRTDLIVSDETSKGQTWYAEVTPNDGEADGATYLSNNVSIPPAIAPTIAAVILNTTSGGNYSYENLTTHVINATDANGDSIKNLYNWYVDNVSITALYLPFEGGSTTTSTSDASGNNNDGTVTGATLSTTAGIDGWGTYSFDGNDYITITDSSSLDINNFTYTAWLKVNSASDEVMGTVENVVNESAGDVNDIYSVDIDGDGDLDILSATYGGDHITWWNNTNGDGSGWTNHTINGTFDAATSVHAADLDGDGDVDVLGAAYGADVIAWWENDGSETFTQHLVNDSFVDGAYSVYATDINGDGNMDIIGSNIGGGGGIDKVTWWNNTNGDGTHWENFTIAPITIISDVTSLHAADIDSDGDMDVIAGQNAGAFDKVIWLDNTNGDGTDWENHTINASFNDVYSIYAADINGDGNMDVLAASVQTDDIVWMENDGNENFTTHTINSSFDGVRSVQAADIDNDGDIDVLGTAQVDDDITWWENNGSGTFVQHTINGSLDLAFSLDAADIDNDGDIDVIGTSAAGAGRIDWWENNGKGIFAKNNQNAEKQDIAITVNSMGDLGMSVRDVEQDTCSVRTTSQLNDSSWHYVAFSFSGTSAKVYVDGVLDQTTTCYNMGMINNSADILLGKQFNGTMDELRLYNRELSAGQIQLLYENNTDLLSSGETDNGDMWYAAVTPTDAEATGVEYYSNNVTIVNSQPYFSPALEEDKTAVINALFTYNITAIDNDGDPIYYFDNSSRFNMSNSTGLINWTPDTIEVFDVNISACDNSGALNNCTSGIITFTVAQISTIINSSINYTHYNGSFSNISGITDASINISNITGPVISVTSSNIFNSNISNSTILRCNISDSAVTNVDCVDAFIDPSDVMESNTTDSTILDSHVWYSNATNSNISYSTVDYSDIVDSNVTSSTVMKSNVDNSNIINDANLFNSTIINSTIDGSIVNSSTVTNSTIINSTVLDSIVLDANITDGTLYDGNLTYNGTTYDADAQGATNITNVINYAPTAVGVATPPSGTAPLAVIFNATTSTDPNIPGDFINDTLTYEWDFGDGSDKNYTNVTTHTYSSAGTYRGNLTVTDAFGKSDTTPVTISVSAAGGTTTSSGGGGGSSSSGSSTTIQFTETGVETCLALNDQISFTFNQTMHTITLTQLGDYYGVLSMPSVEGNLLGGGILLYVDQNAKYDLNRDKYYDFYMEFERIYANQACLFIQSMHQAVQPTTTAQTFPYTPEEKETTEEPTVPAPRPPVRRPPVRDETYSPAVRPARQSPDQSLKDILLKILPIALVAFALLGVVLHKRAKVHVTGKLPPVERYITNAIAKGKTLHDIHNDLLNKGWSEESIYAAELKHLILTASKKMSIKDVQSELIRKGWPKDMVKSAVLGHFVREHLSKGKSFDHVKNNLLKAGWKEHEIHKHLKKAR